MNAAFLAAVDAGAVLVQSAKALGGGVVDGVVQAIVSAAGVVIVSHGTRRVYRWAKDRRQGAPAGQGSLPAPVGTGRARPGFQPVTGHGRRYAYGGRQSRSSMISRKRSAAQAGGYSGPGSLGWGGGSWDGWEVQERRKAAEQLRETRAFRRARAGRIRGYGR